MEEIIIQDLLLDQIKNTMISKVIESLKETKDMTEAEKEIYEEQLRQKVSEKKMATVIRNQGGITDADAYNQTGFELYLDVVLVFDYINEIASAISRHIVLNRSIINHVYSQISELNDSLDEYLSVMSTPGSPYCFYESFNTETNKENSIELYRERYNEKVPEECILYGDTEHKCLTLGYSRKQNVIVYKNGVVMGSISITKQYGSGFVKARNVENKLENAIDTSKSSYWSETILANGEFKIKGQDFESGFGQKPLNRSFYDLPRGALCEICLTFESLTKVNELDLSPFGSFPVDIIAVRYSMTDDEDDVTYEVVAPKNNQNEWLTSKTIDKPFIFHFPEIQCKKLYILLNQLHCIRNTYLVSSNQLLKNQLWFNSIEENESQLKTDSSSVFVPVLMDQAEENPIWKYIMNRLMSNKKIDINDSILNPKDKMVPVTKYQYTYGFYNIAPNYVEFQRTGVYVTKDISIDGAIKSIKLYTEEEHYPSTEGFVVTDIEFYVTGKPNPSYTDWIPICPYNKTTVERELLQLDYSVCYLRHKAICETKIGIDKDGNQKLETIRPIVYMNDIVLMENTDYILRFDEDLFVTAIEISNIDHFAMYTVSYIPVDTKKEITLVNEENDLKANNVYEEIMGNGSACYQLNEYPFYDENNKDTHLKIMNIATGNVISERIGNTIECVTNKSNTDDSFKSFTKSNILQYYTMVNFCISIALLRKMKRLKSITRHLVQR